jgi:alanyl-tRNA synthetase
VAPGAGGGPPGGAAEGVPADAARPYFDDPYLTRFAAAVTARRQDAAGLWVALDLSYFYPESGGQEADRGSLAGVPVLDVREDAAGVVWHRVERDVPDRVAAEIDADRRASNRRQHTGQHVLSQAFLCGLGANTVSSHLGDAAGTLDFDRPSLTWEEIERVEAEANRVVWEDRPVISRLVAAADLGRYALRRPPKVEGTVRLLEIEGWDVSACGGTHCARTGEIGAIKILGWEKMRGNVRIEFVCGDRAWRDHAWRVRQMVEAGRRRNTGDREVIEVLERALAERDDLRKQLRALEAQAARAEAAELAAEHRAAGGAVLCRVFGERSADSLRALSRQLTGLGVERVVLAARGPAPLVVAGRPRGGGEDLRRWLPALLEQARGRGGGGPDEVQVTAADGEAAAAAAEALAQQWR